MAKRSAPVVRPYDLNNLAKHHPTIWVTAFVLAFVSRTRAARGGNVAIMASPDGAELRRGKRPEQWQLLTPTSLNASEVVQFGKSFNEKTVTEYAAIAVAGAQIATVLGLRFREVTLVGERGDYWLETADGGSAGMCEISGTVTKSLQGVFKEKRKQILKNRLVSRCYVSVTNFARNEGAFSRVR